MAILTEEVNNAVLFLFSLNSSYPKRVISMKELHVCPECNTTGWVGPPFQGRWGKLKAIAFHIRRRTLFSKDSKKYPFVRCSSCGYVVTVEEWGTLTDEPLQERLEREELLREYHEYIPKPKAVHQDVSKFMKHGHQAPWYRKSVKAKVQPEEEED